MIAKRMTFAVAAASLVLVLAGCSTGAKAPQTQGGSSSTQSTSPENAPAPTLTITAPTEGATIAPGDVEVKVAATNLEFVMPSNKNVAGQGHVHFTLDDRPFQMSVEPNYTFKDVAAGTHKLRAELVQNNTDPFDPPVFQEITFEVK
jgi:hypothetical protein